MSCRSARPCRCTLALGSPSQIEGPLFVTGPICPVFGGTACDARENVAGLFGTSRASISVHETSLLCPLVLPHPLWMPFWRGSVVLAFFAALLLLYIMAGGSGGHQTTLNEIGSACLMAPQHATGRIGLCPAEHTVWFDVRGILRFCTGFSSDEWSWRGSGGAEMAKVQRPWQHPGDLTERMPGSWSCEFPALRDYVRCVPGRRTEREFIRICTCI